MIAIIDYGAGNLRSVANAIDRLGCPASITGIPEEILRAEAVVLPGVGAAGDTMAGLQRLGLTGTIHRLASVIGNLIPVPFLLLFFDAVSRLIQKTAAGKRLIEWLLTRTSRRTGVIQKYKQLGLMVFVALPLPFTGAWTGSLASYILGLKFWYAFIPILIGVFIAAIIVTILTLLGWVGAGIAIGALIILAVIGVWKL